MQTDGYKGYRDAGSVSGITHVGCWAHTRRKFDEAMEYIEMNVPARSSVIDSYITISGRVHITNKMKNIINQADKRIYLSMAPSEIGYVDSEIEDAVKRG